MLWMPMAATVPMSVASTAAITATSRVTYSECRMSASWNSSAYQRVVKPFHRRRDLELLNENTISTTMGA